MADIIDDKTPREPGFRMPAEWEPQDAIWLLWPGRHPTATDNNDFSCRMRLEKNLGTDGLGNPSPGRP